MDIHIRSTMPFSVQNTQETIKQEDNQNKKIQIKQRNIVSLCQNMYAFVKTNCTLKCSGLLILLIWPCLLINQVFSDQIKTIDGNTIEGGNN